MECQKCGTWNPDDKVRCWRCSAELPRPTQPRKSRKISSQTWLWIVAILFSLLTFLVQCGFLDGGQDSGTGFKLAPMPDGPVVRLEPHEGQTRQMAWWRERPIAFKDGFFKLGGIACNGGI
jgi:hypothetical protein